MKTKYTIIATLFCGSAIFCSAEPAAAEEEKKAPAAKEEAAQKKEAQPWLGVTGKSVNAALANHLNIKKGLTLSDVASGSPAEKAGLAKHDIVTKINDSIIAKQDDIDKALKNKMPENKVTVHFVKNGQQMKKEITLGHHPDKPEKAKGIRNFAPSLVMQDGDGSVEIRNVDNGVEAIVKDKEGNVIFDGPYATEQDKAVVPEDIRARIERFQINDNGELQLDVENFKGGELELRIPNRKKK